MFSHKMPQIFGCFSENYGQKQPCHLHPWPPSLAQPKQTWAGLSWATLLVPLHCVSVSDQCTSVSYKCTSVLSDKCAVRWLQCCGCHSSRSSQGGGSRPQGEGRQGLPRYLSQVCWQTSGQTPWLLVLCQRQGWLLFCFHDWNFSASCLGVQWKCGTGSAS